MMNGIFELDNNIELPPYDIIAERAIDVLKMNKMFGPGIPKEVPYDIKDERVWFYVLCLRKGIKIPYKEFIGAYNVSISGNLPFNRSIKWTDFEVPVGNHLNLLDTIIDSEQIDLSEFISVVVSGCEFENYCTHIKVGPNLKYIRFDYCSVKNWSGFYDYNIKIDGFEPEDYKIHYGGTNSLFISIGDYKDVHF